MLKSRKVSLTCPEERGVLPHDILHNLADTAKLLQQDTAMWHFIKCHPVMTLSMKVQRRQFKGSAERDLEYDKIGWCRAVRERRSVRAFKAWLTDDQAQEKLKQNITNVLADMFDSHFEVPYIAQYRKQVRMAAVPACMQACVSARAAILLG